EGSVGAGDRPAEAGQLPGDGNGDDRAALSALAIQAPPDAVQALLGVPSDRDDGRGLAVLAALESLAACWRLAVVPRGFDEQAPGVARPGLGDRALTAALAAAVLRRDQAEVAHQVAGALEALEVADRDAQ